MTEFMSLDGVVQAPGGPDEDTSGGFAHGGWSMPYFDADVMGGAYFESIQRSEALLFGRHTWEVSAAAWPARGGDPFADLMNEIPKYVVSSTLAADEMRWNTTLIPGGDALEEIGRLRARDGGDLHCYGSAQLVQALLRESLVDELNVMVEPILLGGGKAVFPDDGVARPLALVGVATASTGVLLCTYRPAT
ncbi:MAG: dihydrofolate reductase family protein [Gaiellales bacterium]